MFTTFKYQDSKREKSKGILRKCFYTLIVWNEVTVLLFIIVFGAIRADESSRTDVRMFEFTSEFYMPVGPGCLEGLMTSDGSRCRIAIYWIEPAVYHDNSYFLGYSDYIFEKDVVHYWIQGMSTPRTFNLPDKDNVPLLPRDVSPESVARSALAIVNRIRSESQNEGIPLEVGKFFRHRRNQADYSYEVPSEQINNDSIFDNNALDVQILNTLPYGRKYSKETRSDRTIVWQAERMLEGPHVARVTVKPFSSTEHNCDSSMFDPNSLGQWTLVLEPYRAYWSFDRAYSELKETPDDIVAYELYDKIESYLDKNKVPERIDIAFNQLLFKTSLLTGNKKRVSLSAQDVVSAFCRDASVNSYQNLLELARIDDQIREQYPEQADDIVCPLAGLMIRHNGQNTQTNLERLMPTIENNKWFSYGKLLVEEAHLQGLVEKDFADNLLTRLEATRLSKELPPADPCEACASVKQYLAQLDADPPKGNLTMDNVREILEKGLAKPFADANLDSRDEVIENVIYTIRLITGDGPFCGDKAKLIESVERFSGLYLVVFRNREPIDTVLATFLALTFCDISTQDDHDELFSQIQKLCEEFQTLTNNMLAERGLSELVEPNDIERLFSRYKQRFRNYIDDPLWPPFKFPLTPNEQTGLRNKLKLRFEQLEPILDEMARKVKYGGVSDELKEKTRYEIASAILHLLPQAAFLRRPPYLSVSCRFRGKYGFSAVIKGPLYIEGDRPREKFKAMKYFHLGHRLEDIVKRERELVVTH